jgi:MFS family permease
LFGFDTAVISGTTDALTRVYRLNEPWLGIDADGFWLGFTVARALVGTVMGALAVGRPADRWGRRTTLVWMAVFYFVAAGAGVARPRPLRLSQLGARCRSTPATQ